MSCQTSNPENKRSHKKSKIVCFFLQCSECSFNKFKVIGWNRWGGVRNPKREKGWFLLYEDVRLQLPSLG